MLTLLLAACLAATPVKTTVKNVKTRGDVLNVHVETSTGVDTVKVYVANGFSSTLNSTVEFTYLDRAGGVLETVIHNSPFLPEDLPLSYVGDLGVSVTYDLVIQEFVSLDTSLDGVPEKVSERRTLQRYYKKEPQEPSSVMTELSAYKLDATTRSGVQATYVAVLRNTSLTSVEPSSLEQPLDSSP